MIRARLSGLAPLLVGLAACAPASQSSSSSSLPPRATTTAEAPESTATAPRYAKASSSKVAGLDDHAWPPAPIAGDAKASAAPEDEGEWVAFDRPWMHAIEGAPPTFYTTVVRPDPNRKAKVQIVALDARQLELDLAIGVEGPFPPDESAKGKWPRGGMLPRDERVAKHVVAAFNGGFRFDQGAWGMMIDRRVFMPPVKNVASLLVHDDGRLGFGSWGPAMKTPEDVRSLRQNLDPLIDDGVINPRKRLRWGGIKAQGVQVGQRAKRTGICRTGGGDFLYLWGNDLEAQDLGVAMKKAGCDYGMHLDMNVFHVGFVFMSFEDAAYENGDSEVLSPNMGANKKRYLKQPSPKEFFYATLREPTAIAPTGAGLAWKADGYLQPPPTWLPAILATHEGEVSLTFFAASRIRLRIVGGDTEPRLAEAPIAPALAGDDAARVLAAIELGAAGKNAPFGLVLDGTATTASATSAAATLSIDERGRAFILLPGETSTARSWAQAPLVIADGKALAASPDVAFALGVTAHGDLVVAEKRGAAPTTTQLLAALVRAGCVRAIAARRAGAGKLLRMGREDVLVGGPETQLFVLAERPPPATERFDRDAAGAPRWPLVTTPVPTK